MTAKEMIAKLYTVPEDTPVYAMGATPILFYVTGADHDYVTMEEKEKDFCEAHNLDGLLKEFPNYAKRI